ncbi:alanine racemase [Fistulifera solaris]|jgi:alanine racemase|uniref:Alanine racemase n=1 Tax=Fistulifera solaris TaxID=1519565 RepID=A0A1Z5JLT9_FISSO|nr:alanine racemase [Fistulifera solaris]|eukprot:GAX14980.1 alanine racemase [Fistulifera solaris]
MTHLRPFSSYHCSTSNLPTPEAEGRTKGIAVDEQAQLSKTTKSKEGEQRVVHRIRLSALEHNYACVEAAANEQSCSVITVVKADGYGHGAIATALHLADCCGADAFAVATLEEAIQLRRAFENNPPGRWSKQLASHFPVALDSSHPSFWENVASSTQTNGGEQVSVKNPSMRPSRIRIIVLGPPVNFPRCFDEYLYHGIELMVSGPEVAEQLLAWVRNSKERKCVEVEQAANEAKAKALFAPLGPRDAEQVLHNNFKVPVNLDLPNVLKDNLTQNSLWNPQDSGTEDSRPISRQSLIYPSSTLGNVQGQDLAKEVRALLLGQRAAKEAASQLEERQGKALASNPVSTDNSSTDSHDTERQVFVPAPLSDSQTRKTCSVFAGIDAEARNARARELAKMNNNQNMGTFGKMDGGNTTTSSAALSMAVRKRLRWHASVDTGMGRLGFKVDKPDENEHRRDTIEILKELVDAEILSNAPIEFFGMCTHMAEANATSTYSHSQMEKFIWLLNRVRAAGINIPTVSTDNSAALLTTSLTHFDAEKILSQDGSNTRGFVRVGGAIFGQRPAFPQLKAVSTLCASIRHVAILKTGDSVGYDRAYVAPHDVRIGTLTIGFADGYPRALGNGVGKVQIRGKVFPVAGNICMDMMMVDLGPVGDKEDQVGASVCVGDTAILWGPAGEEEDQGMVRLQDIAEELKTTLSAMTCGLDKLRVKRYFI